MNSSAPVNDTHYLRPRHIPFPVYGIACLQFLRAALIAWVAFAPMRGYSMAPIPISVMQVLTLDAVFFVPEHPFSHRVMDIAQSPDDDKAETAMLVIWCLPVAGYCLYLGFGLLLRNLNACGLAAVTSLLTVLFWLRGLLFSWALQDIHREYFTSGQSQSNILLALLLNLLIFCYLAYDEHVARAFIPPRHNAHGF